MKNHQLFKSEIIIPLSDLLGSTHDEVRLKKMVREILINDLVKDIDKSGNLTILENGQTQITGGKVYSLSLVLIDLLKYRELERIIESSNIKVMKDGNTIYLRDLL